MRRSTVLSILLFLVLVPACKRHSGDNEPVEPQKDSIPALGFFTEDFNVDSTRVRDGETFSGLMTRLGLGARAAYTLV